MSVCYRYLVTDLDVLKLYSYEEFAEMDPKLFNEIRCVRIEVDIKVDQLRYIIQNCHYLNCIIIKNRAHFESGCGFFEGDEKEEALKKRILEFMGTESSKIFFGLQVETSLAVIDEVDEGKSKQLENSAKK